MKILSCGAGMQSTALALMSCENALAFAHVHGTVHPLVPIYDAVIFCDLGMEPPWVMSQVHFIRRACESAGIHFKILESPLYADFMKNFGERRTISIPWWTIKDDGHKSKMHRNCTIDYKVEVISKYVRWELLGYRKGQRLRPADQKTHEMHMGFSFEERRRCKENPNPMFVNHFPLVDLGWTHAESFAYIKGVWGLETKASACTFCPYHKNYFFPAPERERAGRVRPAGGSRSSAARQKPQAADGLRPVHIPEPEAHRRPDPRRLQRRRVF